MIENKSANPDDNQKLAKCIQNARKANMPQTTINNFLKRMTEKGTKPLISAYFETKGPGGVMVLVHVMTENLPHLKHTINYHMKKSKSVVKLYRNFQNM